MLRRSLAEGRLAGRRDRRRAGSSSPSLTDSDLAAVVAAWDRLPAAVKAAMAAMAQAAAKGS
jgi:hypothetical protein